MRKFLILPIFLTCLVGTVSSALAQTATLTATVRPNPLELQLITPSTVTIGQWFDISASVSNKGGEVIHRTMITLYPPAKIVARGIKKNLGDLQPGETRTVSWQVKAKSAGNFIIVAEVIGKLAGEQISASDSTLISASSSPLTSFWRRLIFGG